jgi:hypothetical protein
VPAGAPAPEVARSADEALGRAVDRATTPVVCVAGSLYLIGEVLARHAETPR